MFSTVSVPAIENFYRFLSTELTQKLHTRAHNPIGSVLILDMDNRSKVIWCL